MQEWGGGRDDGLHLPPVSVESVGREGGTLLAVTLHQHQEMERVICYCLGDPDKGKNVPKVLLKRLDCSEKLLACCTRVRSEVCWMSGSTSV